MNLWKHTKKLHAITGPINLAIWRTLCKAPILRNSIFMKSILMLTEEAEDIIQDSLTFREFFLRVQAVMAYTDTMTGVHFSWDMTRGSAYMAKKSAEFGELMIHIAEQFEKGSLVLASDEQLITQLALARAAVVQFYGEEALPQFMDYYNKVPSTDVFNKLVQQGLPDLNQQTKENEIFGTPVRREPPFVMYDDATEPN